MINPNENEVLKPVGLVHATNVRLPIAVLGAPNKPYDDDGANRFDHFIGALGWFLRVYGLFGVAERIFGPLVRSGDRALSRLGRS